MDYQIRQFCNTLGPDMRVEAPWLVKTLRKGAGTRPAVDVVLLGEQQVVYKNYVAAAPIFGQLLGPLLVWRESRSLQRLQNLSGTPALLGRVGKRGLVMEKIEAVPVLQATFDIDWAHFFQHYVVLLDNLHALGVAHGDLRSPHNTLVNRRGQPYVVDFVASVQRGRAWNLPANWLFRRLVLVDRSAVLKLKKRLAPELLSAEERVGLGRSTGLGRMAQGFGQVIRQLSRKLFSR